MYEFIEGKIIEKSPAHLVVKTGGIGYFIHISLNTYAKIENKDEALIYVHPIIREDAHSLFGFADKSERNIFLLLVSVSGVGANTARMILSSLSPGEVKSAILDENVNAFKSIKGIGAKSAQRIIVDLIDKVDKDTHDIEIIKLVDNTSRDEALSALVMLGFVKRNVEKVVDGILKQEPGIKLEDLIKIALKQL